MIQVGEAQKQAVRFRLSPPGAYETVWAGLVDRAMAEMGGVV